MPYKTQLEWLLKLAKCEAWKSYAWSRAKELESDPSELWAGLSSDLKQRMTGPEKAAESGHQSATKPRSHGRKSG